MLQNNRLLVRITRSLVALAFLLACVAAAPLERPDAVIITEAEPQLLCSLFPMLAHLDDPPLLVYSPHTEPYISDYLTQIAAERVWLIDPARKAPAAWRKQYRAFHDPPAKIVADLSKQCWTESLAVVLASDPDREIALAACLVASARQVPAFWLREPMDAALHDLLRHLAPAEIVLVGKSAAGFRPSEFPESKITELKTLSDAHDAYRAALGVTAPEHLVVLASRRRAPQSAQPDIAPLVPQYAVRHRAALAMLNGDEDTDTELRALVQDEYRSVKYVTLWGDAEALPDSQVEDPVAAAGLETRLTDRAFPVPPLSGLGRREPCQFRVGRITGDSASSASLLVARNLRRPTARATGPPRALILANVDSELPLMETITRTTAQTIEQVGWRVKGLYGWRAARYRRPGQPWGADLVLYEGHTADLERVVHFDHDRDPVVAGLYLFQGCRTLIQPQVTALIRNGAAGVVGTTTKTYSASGSALAKAYVDAMLLDDMDAGTSLMVARNFMLALAELGERRQHTQTPKIIRGGMTFALWGDPTWKLPPSPHRVQPSDCVHAVAKGSVVELKIPEQENWSPKVEGDDYVAQIPVGAKLAGWYEWEDQEQTRRQLPPLYFAVVPLPEYDGAEPPQLSTRLARNRWSSLWDPRNRWLYLLVHGTARSDRDQGKTINFRVETVAQ